MADDKSSAHAPPGAVPPTTTVPSMDGYKADRDWQWFLLVSFVLVLWILRVLVYLITDQFYTTMWAGLLLWVVFGGHKYIQSPAWLREPADSKPSQSTCDCHCKAAFATKKTDHDSVKTAPLIDLSYSLIVSIHDDAPQEPTFDTIKNEFSPITFIHHHAPQKHELTSTNGSVIPVINTADNGVSPIIIKADSFTLNERNDKMTKEDFLSLLAADRIEKDAGQDDMLPEVGDVEGARRMLAELDDLSSPSSSSSSAPVDPEKLGEELRALFSGTVSPVTGPYTPHASISDTVNEQVGTAPESSEQDTPDEAENGSEDGAENKEEAGKAATTESPQVIPSASAGPIFTAPSSITPNGEHSGTANVIKHDATAVPKHWQPMTATQLQNLLKIHEYPRFCEGPLGEACSPMYAEHRLGVKWTYNVESIADGTDGVDSEADIVTVRPIEGDAGDIQFMLNKLWDDLPEDYRVTCTSAHITQQYANRSGETGRNLFINTLEGLWYKNHEQTLGDFTAVSSTPEQVRIWQMHMSRRHRRALLPGMILEAGSNAQYATYLTDAETIEINQGDIEYNQMTEDAQWSKKLLELEQSSDHAGAQSPNLVPAWLDGIDQSGLYDPNAYLPFICGRTALEAHDTYRSTNVQDTDHTCQLDLLGEGALEVDKKRKVSEEAHFEEARGDRPAEYPRSQKFRQNCSLHAIPTNLPWILVDGVEDLNEALVGGNNDLPVPGFTEFTEYPENFRLCPGFQEIAYTDLAPRCPHGYMHPPFADQCMRCFSAGEHEDCAECNTHMWIPSILRDPSNEKLFEDLRKALDGARHGMVRKHEEWDRHQVAFWQGQADYTNRHFITWPRFDTIDEEKDHEQDAYQWDICPEDVQEEDSYEEHVDEEDDDEEDDDEEDDAGEDGAYADGAYADGAYADGAYADGAYVEHGGFW